MMETPAHILASLVCTKCDQLLKRGPVYQQHDGAAVCGLCQEREDAQPASRCFLYEATAELVRFPCRYQEEGCPATVPFVAADSTEFSHEDACEYRQYVCPVLGSDRCEWTGHRNQMLQHCEEKHSDRVLANPTQITPDIRRFQMENYIIYAYNFLFLLHTRVCVSTAKLHYAVRLLGDPQEASSYIFTVTIQRGDDIIIRSKNVLRQEVLALQEHSALNFSINGLLGMLGGWDGASLSVEVKAREPQADLGKEQAPQRRQAEQVLEQCLKCKALKPRLYCDDQGWLCADCAPQKKTCENEGCDFQGYGELKTIKHSEWFCQRRTSCFACRAVLPPGRQLQQHYTTCRRIKVIPAGSRFLLRCNNNKHWFLVETAAGHVICDCCYTQYKFSLEVYSPVPSEQLHLHRCEMQLECAGNTRTHTLDTEYYYAMDWDVEYYKDNFFRNRDVHVSLQVKKME